LGAPAIPGRQTKARQPVLAYATARTLSTACGSILPGLRPPSRDRFARYLRMKQSVRLTGFGSARRQEKRSYQTRRKGTPLHGRREAPCFAVTLLRSKERAQTPRGHGPAPLTNLIRGGPMLFLDKKSHRRGASRVSQSAMLLRTQRTARRGTGRCATALEQWFFRENTTSLRSTSVVPALRFAHALAVRHTLGHGAFRSLRRAILAPKAGADGSARC